MRPATQQKLKNYLYDHPLIAKKEYVCNTCYRSIVTLGQRPTLSAYPGSPLVLPELPDELKGLSEMELLVLSPIIPFMKISPRPRGGQMALNGPCISIQVCF